MSLDTRTFSKEYKELTSFAHKNGYNINISTITLLCSLNCTNIDLMRFCDNFSEPDVQLKTNRNPNDYEVTKRGRVKKNFFNQLTLNYKDISKKSIKIFSNGKLQITGLTSYLECNKLIEMICGWLSECLDSDIHAIHMYVGMINSNFSIKRYVDLIQLNNVLNHHENVMSIYNPESYPAINMKYVLGDTKVSVFVFGTGNVVITGSKSMTQMFNAFKFIVGIFKTNMHLLKHVNDTKKTDKDAYMHGYSLRQILCYLE